jgi:hypothetical protein
MDIVFKPLIGMKYADLATIPYDVIETVYVRGWPVILSSWVRCHHLVAETIRTIACIHEGYDDWPKLRTLQNAAGITRMTEVGFYSEIKALKQSPHWRDMPRWLYWHARYEVVSGDTRKALGVTLARWDGDR